MGPAMLDGGVDINALEHLYLILAINEIVARVKGWNRSEGH